METFSITNHEEELLIFMKKVDNLEPVRIFFNDQVAEEKGPLIVAQMNYMADKDWIMTKSNPTADGYFMKFAPQKRILAG